MCLPSIKNCKKASETGGTVCEEENAKRSLLWRKLKLNVQFCMAFGFHKPYSFLFPLFRSLHWFLKSRLINIFDWDITLDARLANFFCKGLDSNYFRFLGNIISVNTLNSALVVLNSHQHYVKKWARLCSNKTLFVYTEFWISHNFYVSWNFIIPLTFFQPLKNLKTILSL